MIAVKYYLPYNFQNGINRKIYKKVLENIESHAVKILLTQNYYIKVALGVLELGLFI